MMELLRRGDTLAALAQEVQGDQSLVTRSQFEATLRAHAASAIVLPWSGGGEGGGASDDAAAVPGTTRDHPTCCTCRARSLAVAFIHGDVRVYARVLRVYARVLKRAVCNQRCA
jgi:hypothetical protein